MNGTYPAIPVGSGQPGSSYSGGVGPPPRPRPAPAPRLIRWASVPVVAAALALPAPAGEKLQFNRDVRPILAENCFPCHGPDSAARKANLRLDRRDDALDAEAFVPGDPAK